MDKFKNAILKQLEGQKNRQYCPACEKETLHMYHGTGKANCEICGNEVEIDLTDFIKDLKSMGAYIG